MEDGAQTTTAREAALDRAARTIAGATRLGAEGSDDDAAAALAWAESAADGAELQVAALLAAARSHGRPAASIERTARARLLAGPVRDALACLPFIGDPRFLWTPDGAVHRARLDLLLWDAAAAALGEPGLGALLGDEVAREGLVLARARGPLRDRSLAARALATAADDLAIEDADPAVLAQLDRCVHALATHPEPAVWTHAARATGRLAARVPEIRMRLLAQLDSANPGERRRAVTALAAVPAAGGAWAGPPLEQCLARSDDPWTLAAVGPSVPHLSRERRDAWDRLALVIAKDDTGPEVLSSVTTGLTALARRDDLDRASQRLLRRARDRALAAAPRSDTEAQLWRAIRRDTDFLDGMEPDPGDLDLCLERVAAAAVRHGAARVQERAVFFARSLRATFENARRSAAETTGRDDRAAALAVMESCSRAAALGLWTPILGAAGRDPAPVDAAAEEARRAMLAAATEDLARPAPDFELHRVAMRVLGHVADATPRGRVAAQVHGALDAAPWLPLLKKRDAARFAKPAADVLWRVLDATRRGSAPADPQHVARFAAWSALASTSLELFDLFGRAEAAAREDAEARVRAAVVAIREALDPTTADALSGAWAAPVGRTFAALGVADTALARGMSLLAAALVGLAQDRAWPTADSLTAGLTLLAEARDTLIPSLENPELALAAPAPRPASSPGVLVDESVAVRKAGEPDAIAARWREGMGPVLGPLVARAVRDLCQVHAGRDARPTPSGPPRIGRYVLHKQLGAGAMGVVWLAHDPQTDRCFVVKVPAGDFAEQPMAYRAELERSLATEASMLRAIYHPNVASFVDHGWHEGRPYLVLEYLIGVDLSDYAAARPLELDECKPIVQDLCAGLRTLHGRGLVHCDLKPGNVFVRLDLPPFSVFEPARHRDPAATPMLSAIVIDFGLVRMFGRPHDAAGAVRGTPGFLAPEQAMGGLAVDSKADVYGLAATVYAAMTGRRFFDDTAATAACLQRHATEAPLRERATTKMLTRKLAGLLRDATELDPTKRPDAAEFAARFAEL